MAQINTAVLTPRALKDNLLVIPLQEVGISDIPLVGGKNASLGEMLQQLTPKGVAVPQGFATTAHAYRAFINSAGLEQPLRQLFKNLNIEDVEALRQVGKQARDLILNTPFPDDLNTAIATSYQALCQQYGENTDVAVRSSATAEDLPDSIALSVGVQKMVRSDLATSGVIFSIAPETGFKNVVLVSAAYGLGETIVQGAVNPDEYLVFKPTLKQGHSPILKKRLGSKEIKMIYDLGGGKQTKNVPVPQVERQQFTLTDTEVLTLARWACVIEDHYSTVRQMDTPMDIEWAKDGLTGELFIVQARPETVQSQKSAQILKTYKLSHSGTILVRGRAVGEMIGQGQTRVILDTHNLEDFQQGKVLVTHRTDPDWEPIMKKASAIVTNQGGRTCHAAIIAREMGIPAIVGCGNATDRLQTGIPVTLSCAEGEEGRVYEGLIPFKVQETPLDSIPKNRTQILLNVGNPEEAFSLAALPCDGVGLARLEFIIANQIKIHPQALLHFEKIKSAKDRNAIAKLTAQFNNKPEFFVETLAQGIGTISAAFYPKPAIVRMSDFKSNEYANLLGGRQFEPKEENPMLGWRGASRYYDSTYRDAFGLECLAFIKVRQEMGLTNVIPMIPFCRTPEEGQRVLDEMAKHGLKRGDNGLEVYMMCELPSNVILAEQFSKIFDGFSIGSNDLTQLTLGLDRDSSLVAHLFDERNEAVKEMIHQVIQIAKANHRKIGICGQAPSDYPEFAQFLVEQGIDSISLNPDSVLKTLLEVAQAESQFLQAMEEG